MFKNKKLSCNIFTRTILSSLSIIVGFSALSFADEYATEQSFDINNDSSTYVDTSLSTDVPPTSQLSNLPKIMPESVKENATKKAFDVAAQQVNGLTPDMIRELRRSYEAKNKAINEVDVMSAIPVSRTITIPLGVSNQKEVIRTAIGYATNISIVDSTGKPWNVENITVGNSQDFKFSRLDDPKGYLFSLTTKKNNIRSNVIFLLSEGKGKSIKVPIVLDVISGQKEIDDKIVIRVQGIGPNGSIEQTRLSQGIDSKYISWLDGVVPSHVKKLKSSDKFLKAWRDVDGSIVVITKYQVYSPLSTVMLASSDGEVTLYKLSAKSSVVRARDMLTKEEKSIYITGF